MKFDLKRHNCFWVDDLRGTSEQKTIHEKWDEGDITILPPKEKLT